MSMLVLGFTVIAGAPNEEPPERKKLSVHTITMGILRIVGVAVLILFVVFIANEERKGQVIDEMYRAASQAERIN
jgi:hypothetical protein